MEGVSSWAVVRSNCRRRSEAEKKWKKSEDERKSALKSALIFRKWGGWSTFSCAALTGKPTRTITAYRIETNVLQPGTSGRVRLFSETPALRCISCKCECPRGTAGKKFTHFQVLELVIADYGFIIHISIPPFQSTDLFAIILHPFLTSLSMNSPTLNCKATEFLACVATFSCFRIDTNLPVANQEPSGSRGVIDAGFNVFLHFGTVGTLVHARPSDGALASSSMPRI